MSTNQPPVPRPEPDTYPVGGLRVRPRVAVLLTLAVLALLLAAVLLAVSGVAADGPILWKMHCPRWHDVQIVPADDWGGVHVLCVMMAEEAEMR